MTPPRGRFRPAQWAYRRAKRGNGAVHDPTCEPPELWSSRFVHRYRYFVTDRDRGSTEIQSALNEIWKATPSAVLSELLRARLVSLGLVVTLGFLMLVSLTVSAGLTALGTYLSAVFAQTGFLISVPNWTISLVLISALFAAIYKILPDKPIAWRDVAIGSVTTAILFTIGKSLIGFYIGRSGVASGYGAAGAILILLLWVYYSAQIFLLGAEYTRAYAEAHGSQAADP